MDSLTPQPWMDDALCAQTGIDDAIWYPSTGDSWAPRHAKAICARCPVAAECLAYALANGETHGVWGGTTEKDRRKMPKPQRLCVECGHPMSPNSSTRYERHGRCNPKPSVRAEANRRAQAKSEAARAVMNGGLSGRRVS